MLDLDTHMLLYAATGALSATEIRLRRGDGWSISAIVLWEIAKLAQLGRIDVESTIGRSSVRWRVSMCDRAALQDIRARRRGAKHLRLPPELR
jgi:PIN domain nuclease of toxin-antitoxin system